MIFLVIFCLTMNAYSAVKPDEDLSLCQIEPQAEIITAKPLQPIDPQTKPSSLDKNHTFTDVEDPNLRELGAEQVGVGALLGTLSTSYAGDSYTCIILPILNKEEKALNLYFLPDGVEDLITEAFLNRAWEHRLSLEDTCICTTLHSLPTFYRQAENHNLFLHVAARQGCLEYQAPNNHVENDFTAIISANENKKIFMFLDTVGTSFLPAGEFLVQCQDLAEKGASLIVGFAIHEHAGDYNVGDIAYGAGPARTRDKEGPKDKLITRAVQAERLAQQEGPCDQEFMDSRAFQKRYLRWRDFIEKHVTFIVPEVACFGGKVVPFTASTNVQCTQSQTLQGVPVVLIGAPYVIPIHLRAFLIVSAIKTFTTLVKVNPHTRYMIIDDPHTKGTQPCAGDAKTAAENSNVCLIFPIFQYGHDLNKPMCDWARYCSQNLFPRQEVNLLSSPHQSISRFQITPF